MAGNGWFDCRQGQVSSLSLRAGCQQPRDLRHKVKMWLSILLQDFLLAEELLAEQK